MNPVRSSGALFCLPESAKVDRKSEFNLRFGLVVSSLAWVALMATSAARAQTTREIVTGEGVDRTAGVAQVQAIKLLAPDVGWALEQNRLYWTGNDGVSWNDITPNSARGKALHANFLDATHGWVILANDVADDAQESITIASTQTAGKTWQYSTIDSGVFPEIHRFAGVSSSYFLNAEQGWIVFHLQSSSNFSVGALLHTEDGGSTWAELPTPPAAGEIHFLSPLDGWIAGGPSVSLIWFTGDGGRTWRESEIPIPEGCSDCRITVDRPVFRNAKDATMSVGVIDVDRTGVASLASADGGLSWRIVSVDLDPVKSESSTLRAMVGAQNKEIQVSESEISIVGKESVIRGNVPEELRKDGVISRADFISESSGWLVYSAGWCRGFKADCKQSRELIATSDGGKTFRVITPSSGFREELWSGGAGQTLIEPLFEGARAPAVSPSPIPEATGPVISENTSGFDTACVPPKSTMKTWFGASPYRVMGFYLGGCNASCVPPAALGGQSKCDTGWFAGTKSVNTNLSESWITTVTGDGWDLIPIWVGPQAPCIGTDDWLIENSADGKTQADQAISQASLLGITNANGIIYYDMEGYDEDGANCSNAVIAFMSAWNAEMNAKKFATGIYGSLEDYVPAAKKSGGDFLSISPQSGAAWIAAYSTPPNESVFGLTGLPPTDWSNNQRIHQWGKEPDTETWGNVSIPPCLPRSSALPCGIDWDTVDAPVVGGSEPQRQAATPTFVPTAGSYSSAQTVTISDATPNATIYYSVNGIPTTASSKYSSPISVSTSETIGTIAVASGYSPSAVGTAAYVIIPPHAVAPTFSPVAATYTSMQSVTIKDATPNAVIYYAINSTPTTSSTKYTTPIIVSMTETIEAIAVAPGHSPSGVGLAPYTITLAPAISVTPTSSVIFPNTPVGSSSTENFTVQNSGGGTLTGAATVASPFSIASGGSYSLGAGASQTITVRFSPTAVKSYSQSLAFTGGAGASRTVNGTGTTVTIKLSGTTACYKGGPEINLSWTLSGNTAKNYDVYRNGALYASGITGTAYANTANLAGGAIYSYHIMAHLNGSGTANSNTASATAPANCAVPVISVTPITTVGFPSTPVGSSSAENFTVQNTGYGILTGTASVGSPFSIASGGSYSLGAGASQTIALRFSPAAAKSYSQSVSFTGGAGAMRTVTGTGVPVMVTLSSTTTCFQGGPKINLSFTVSGGTESTFDLYRNGTLYSQANTGTTFANFGSATVAGQKYTYYVVVHLSGGGTTTSNTVNATAPTNCAVPVISVTPTATVGFPNTPVGSSSTENFTVQNTGYGTLTGTASVAALFSIASGANYILGAGAKQTVTVRFSPTTAHSYSQNVSFSGGTGTSRTVTGTGNQVTVNLSATTACYQGTPEINLSFTVSGGTESTFDLWRNGASYSPGNTGTTFANYGSATVAGQSYSYYVVVHLSSGGTATSNTVNATAPTNCAAPVISVTPPTTVGFPNTPVGSSATQNFSVQNTGNGTLNGSASVAAPFSIASGASYSLGAGAKQSVTVRFSPTSSQSYSQSVTFSGGAGANRTVTGTGTLVSVNLSAATACNGSGPEINLSFTVLGGTESTFDLWRNGASYSPGNTGTTFANYGGATVAGQTYSYFVVVHLIGGGAATSNTVNATAPTTCAAPTITSIVPNPVPLSGNSRTPVDIYGTGFVSGGTLHFTWMVSGGGSSNRTDYVLVNSTHVQIKIGTGSVASSGWTVQMINSNEQSSNAYPFSVH